MITTINQRLNQLWSNSNCLCLARNLSLRFAIKTLGNSKPNWSWQNLTVGPIHNICIKSFMKNLLMTKSNIQYWHNLAYGTPVGWLDHVIRRTSSSYYPVAADHVLSSHRLHPTFLCGLLCDWLATGVRFSRFRCQTACSSLIQQ